MSKFSVYDEEWKPALKLIFQYSKEVRIHPVFGCRFLSYKPIIRFLISNKSHASLMTDKYIVGELLYLYCLDRALNGVVRFDKANPFRIAFGIEYPQSGDQ